MLSHKVEEKEESNPFENVYQKLKEQIRPKLNNYEDAIQRLSKEFKMNDSDSKEVKSLLYSKYDEITIQLREFNEVAMEIQMKLIDLEEELKKTISEKEMDSSYYLAQGLVEAIKNSLREYKKEVPESKEAFIDDIDKKLREASNKISHQEVTDIINQMFKQLFSKVRKGAHPFVISLDRNIKKLCISQVGKFAIDSGAVFKITGGTLEARQLIWNKLEQKEFIKKWVKQEVKVLSNIYQKKMDEVQGEGIVELKSRQRKILNNIVYAEEQLNQSKQEILKILVKEVQVSRDNFFIEAKKMLARLNNFKIPDSEIKGESGPIQQLIFEHTQVVESEVKAYLEKPIAKLFFQSDELFGDLESKLLAKKAELNQMAEKAMKETQDIIDKMIKTHVTIHNFTSVRSALKVSLERVQEIQYPVLTLDLECDRLKKKLTKIIKKEFPPVLEILKKINQVVKIVKNETQVLRTKKETNLFKSSGTDKADRIDKSIEIALQNLDIIFKRNLKDSDQIENFFNFKKDPKEHSLKEVLNEKRIFYATPHMYLRIQKKIEAEVLSDTKSASLKLS